MNNSIMTFHETEITKYHHNAFGALKAPCFNDLYEICQKLNLDYNKVHVERIYQSPAHTSTRSMWKIRI